MPQLRGNPPGARFIYGFVRVCLIGGSICPFVCLLFYSCTRLAVPLLVSLVACSVCLFVCSFVHVPSVDSLPGVYLFGRSFPCCIFV